MFHVIAILGRSMSRFTRTHVPPTPEPGGCGSQCHDPQYLYVDPDVDPICSFCPSAHLDIKLKSCMLLPADTCMLGPTH